MKNVLPTGITRRGHRFEANTYLPTPEKKRKSKTVYCGLHDTVSEAKLAKAVKESQLGLLKVAGKLYLKKDEKAIKGFIRNKIGEIMGSFSSYGVREFCEMSGVSSYRVRWALGGYGVGYKIEYGNLVKKSIPLEEKTTEKDISIDKKRKKREKAA